MINPTRTRRRFTAQQKAEAVELCLQEGLSCNKEPISPQQLQHDLAFWIEGYNNCERRHSSIGYLSPIDYEQQFIAARTLTSVNP
jgi:transposase InsO family protein